MGGRGPMVNAPSTASFRSRPHTDAPCSRRLRPAGLLSGTQARGPRSHGWCHVCR